MSQSNPFAPLAVFRAQALEIERGIWDSETSRLRASLAVGAWYLSGAWMFVLGASSLDVQFRTQYNFLPVLMNNSPCDTEIVERSWSSPSSPIGIVFSSLHFSAAATTNTSPRKFWKYILSSAPVGDDSILIRLSSSPDHSTFPVAGSTREIVGLCSPFTT